MALTNVRNLLLVDDDEDDYLLTRGLVSDVFYGTAKLDWARSWNEGCEAIKERVYDICLVDYRLGPENGLDLIHQMTESGYSAPMILLTGTENHSVDLRAMEAGASDFLAKSRLTAEILERSIRYAIKQKKSENALRKSEQKYRELIEESIQGVYVYKNGKFLYVNQAFAQIFNYEVASDFIDFNLVDTILSEHEKTKLQTYFDCCIDASLQGHPDRIEFEGIRKDGSKCWVETSAKLVSWDGDYALQGSLRDITERKTMELMKNEFIAIVNHELRTPLTSLFGSLRLLRSGAIGELPSKVGEMVNIAHNNTERLIHLVNDILDLEKIEAGRMEFAKEQINVVDLANQAIEENQNYGEKYGVKFSIEDYVGEAIVIGDKIRLLQVLANLLSNAAKFSPEGETVYLQLSRCEGKVRLSVIDRGLGIPSEFHKKLFQKFSQADSSDSRKKEGTGLGLNICKNIVDHHGGTIDFNTAVGIGTTFYFQLDEAFAESGAAGENSALSENQSLAVGL